MRRPSLSSATPPIRAEVRPGLWLDSRLALWLAGERLLVLADLHWGYTASHRARGNLLPWWGDDEMEKRLRSLLADYQPAEMLWLGDIVHAAEGAARVEAFLREAPLPVTLLSGNHDRRWRGAQDRTLHRGNIFFHHGDEPRPVPAGCLEVIGHYHPAISWGDGAGARIKLPALVVEKRRLILPAFSPWAVGTRWSSQECEELWAIAPNRIFALPRICTHPPAAAL